MTCPGPRRVRLRAELKQFLVTKRASVTPEAVGLPRAGRRRTPGLRREEVAVLAGVGVSWYTWLEQGRDINVSNSVLDAVSQALRLDNAEHAHLYRLAGLNPPLRVEDGQPEVTPQLRRLVDGWLPSPASLLDRHWNVLVMNDAAHAVFGLTDADQNCLVAFFTSDAYRARHRHWQRIAPALVAEFRRDAARFPDDPRFDEIAEQLRATSPEFATLWAQHDVQATTHATKIVEHPIAGTLSFDLTVLAMPSRPDVRLILHTATAGMGTEEKVAALLARRTQISLAEAG
jgi:transcriptional regulator with XRE-family HTH domain